jgi:hypothetical protein
MSPWTSTALLLLPVISLTKPETNIVNTFIQDYESSQTAGDGQTIHRMASLPFSHHNQGLTTTHIPADEEAMLLMRRMKNKAAATKCRNKKKLKIKQLISQAKMIEETNIQLRRTVAK